jgi:hypothetical protein
MQEENDNAPRVKARAVFFGIDLKSSNPAAPRLFFEMIPSAKTSKGFFTQLPSTLCILTRVQFATTWEGES